MNDSWRYIPLIETNGNVQMSIDLYLLKQYETGDHPPILRFYTWSPVAISLGYHQRQYPDHWNNLIYQGEPIALVRRPTGGRAVLHQGDLCYSLITSDISGSLREGYLKICQFLQVGWLSLGVKLTYGNQRRSYVKHTNCFGTSTSADLVDPEGIKRIGNAQLRRKNIILQQGSIVLKTDEGLYKEIFQSEAPPQLNLSQEVVIESLKRSAARCFEMKLIKQSLQDKEWEQILSQNN